MFFLWWTIIIATSIKKEKRESYTGTEVKLGFYWANDRELACVEVFKGPQSFLIRNMTGRIEILLKCYDNIKFVELSVDELWLELSKWKKTWKPTNCLKQCWKIDKRALKYTWKRQKWCQFRSRSNITLKCTSQDMDDFRKWEKLTKLHWRASVYTREYLK